MSNATATEVNTKSTRKENFINIVSKILLYTVAIVGGIFLLVAIYQIVKFLFVAAILLIAWLGPTRRWRW